MAAVDSLLQIARDQRADGLVLKSGEAPVLMLGQVERKLSMPALDDGMIRMLVAEISDGGVIEVGTADPSPRVQRRNVLRARAGRQESVAGRVCRVRGGGSAAANIPTRSEAAEAGEGSTSRGARGDGAAGASETNARSSILRWRSHRRCPA